LDEREHDHGSDPGHSHGLLHSSIKRSREGVRAVSLALLVLGVATLIQLAIFALSNSVALLADLIHNGGDALTAIPLGIAFVLQSERGERFAGFAVVGAIFISACVAGWQAVTRFIHPQHPTHLWVLTAAGIVGFAANLLAAQIRRRAGQRLESPALVADGDHAFVDSFVSLGVVASAAGVALGAQIADPIIALVLTFIILRVTWESWRTVSTGDLHHHDHHHN
jgi:cation diffusion facilitator family transporter